MALWSEPSRRRLRRETQPTSQVLALHIPRSCTHVRGHGGVKGALWQIQRRMQKARFVARFNIAAYYTSMRHDMIEAQVATTDLDAHHRKLIADYLALPDTRDTGLGMVTSGGLSPPRSTSVPSFAIAADVGLIGLDVALQKRRGKG